jgi:hypothetical protein
MMRTSNLLDSNVSIWQPRIHWALRISAVFCFIGHGAFGILTKPAWFPYFAVAYIPPNIALKLMPLIGTMDITMGVLTLISPRRFALLFMTFWAVWTAFLRPLAGVATEATWWEFLERAGNFGVPFAFLIMSGFPRNRKALWEEVQEPRLNQQTLSRLIIILKWTTALLLIGHGGFGAFKQKPMLFDQWASVGLPGSGLDPVLFITLIGGFEIFLGLFVLIRPFRPVLIFITAWKILTELLYPISGTPIWEFVERFGSYGAPVALFLLLTLKKTVSPLKTEEPG